MWDLEPWLQLQLLTLCKNGLHIKYEFIRQTLKLITKPLNVLYFHEHFRDSFILFCLGSPHLYIYIYITETFETSTIFHISIT